MPAITIVGAGGIGCVLGFALRVAKIDVTLIEAHPGKIVAGNRDGIEVVGQGKLPAHFVSFDEWQPTVTDVILLCTKCYDNHTVLGKVPLDAVLIPVQNGFDAELDARPHTVEGIASFVSECAVDRPSTRITRPGHLHLGYRGDAPSPWRDQLAEWLGLADLFPVVRVERIHPFKYAKLMYNAAISPLAAAAGLDNGDLLALSDARRLFFALLRENYTILSEAGIELGQIGPFHPRHVMRILGQRWLARSLAWAFTPSLRGTYCSMANDLPRGRTEIVNYNQHLIDIAGDTPCPINRAVVACIDRMTRNREIPRREILAELRFATNLE